MIKNVELEIKKMVSIVMPIYNTGILLHESIGSIIAQTYANWELLLIDDASDDGVTTDIVSKYEKNDPRIIHCRLGKRTGAGVARNEGLKKIRGKYVLFLDADDIFDPEMLYIMYNDIKNADADMCICSYSSFDCSKEETISVVEPGNVKGVTDRVFSVSELSESGFTLWNPAPWNKIYKSSFLRRNRIWFQDISSSNDVYFSLMCMAKAKKVVYSSSLKPLVNYRINNSNQISSKASPINFNKACEKTAREKVFDQDYSMKKRLYVFWMLSMMRELKYVKDEMVKYEAYTFLSDYIKRNASRLVFDNEKFNMLLSMYLSEERCGWMDDITSYGAQLEWNRDKIVEIFKDYQNKKVVIWGYGKRGQAFEQFWNKNINTEILITDKNNEDFPVNTRYGNRIIPTEEAFRIADVIAASNDVVYENLKGCERKLVQIEKYCPF